MMQHHPVLYIVALFTFVQGLALMNVSLADIAISHQQTTGAAAQAASAQTAVDALVALRAQQPAEILLVGDIMLDRGVEKQVHLWGGSDYRYPFTHVAEALQSAAITFGNLEGPVSDRGEDSGKRYSFRFAPQAAEALGEIGFDVVSLANNHALDWGREALCDSVHRLQGARVVPIGAGCSLEEALTPYTTTIADTRVAFIAYTDFDQWGVATDEKAGLTPWGEEGIAQAVQHLKEALLVDVVFVSLHWGDEYQTRSHEQQQELGQALINAGADVIVGHHPHVVQEIERYKNGWIIYSLGNFVFDQHFSEETMQGLLVHVVVQGGSILDVQPQYVYLDEHFRPSLKE